MQQQFYELKATMTRVREAARNRIKTLAVRSRDARRLLSMGVAQAERIVRLAEWPHGRQVADPVGEHHPIQNPTDVAADDDPMRFVLARVNRAELARQYARQKRDWLRKGPSHR